MRFHANVCNLAMNKPVSGLAVLNRIKYVHDSVGNFASVVDVNTPFSSVLFKATLENVGKKLPQDIRLNVETAKTDSLEIYRHVLNEIL